MLEILGIFGKGYELKFVKPTVYLHPSDYSKKIRLIMKVIFKSNNGDFSNPLYIYLQSDKKIYIASSDVFNISHKLIDVRYLEGIGADRAERARPLKIGHPIELISGESNSIIIKITPNMEEISQTRRKQIIEDTENMLFGFMIDTIIENEGIEKESLWKQLIGLSRFAWRFQIKLWSFAENIYPFHVISSLTEGKYHKGKSYSVINTTDEIQTFLVIPRGLIESLEQVAVIPGIQISHNMTKKDRGVFLSSEKKEKHKERILEWVEEGASAFSWSYGFTATTSGKIAIEHQPARLTSWSPLTFTTILFTLASIILQVLPQPSAQMKYFWITWPILFCLSYFYTNLRRFSFYELRKKNNLKFLRMFLRISILNCLAILLFILIPSDFLQGVEFKASIIFAFLILTIGGVLTYLVQNRKIGIKYTDIYAIKKIPSLLMRTFSKIFWISVMVLVGIWLLDLDWNSFLLFFSIVYTVLAMWEVIDRSE